MKKFLLLKTIILGILSLPLQSNATESDSIREERRNTITAGIDIYGSLGTSGFAPLLNLGYKYNFNKNFSTGINLKSIIVFNEAEIFERYYLNYLNSRNSSFYVEVGLKYSSVFGSQKYYSSVSLYPSIGYEFIADNGFTVSAGLVFAALGFPSDSKGFNVDIRQLNLNGKLGYSF